MILIHPLLLVTLLFLQTTHQWEKEGLDELKTGTDRGATTIGHLQQLIPFNPADLTSLSPAHLENNLRAGEREARRCLPYSRAYKYTIIKPSTTFQGKEREREEEALSEPRAEFSRGGYLGGYIRSIK